MSDIITSKDFNVHYADPSTIAKLDLALAYLQRSPTGTAIVREAVAAGVNLGINEYHTDHYGDIANPGQDMFDAGTHMVIWNPDSALQIKDIGGTILGVQSAALGLAHELTHSIDPAVLDHMGKDWQLPGYHNAAEYTALTYESMMADELGEVSRSNWHGSDIKEANPTAHTMPTESGLVWAQANEKGEDEYGSQYDAPGKTPAGYVPLFGSTPGYDGRAGSSDDNPYAGDYSPPKNGEGGSGGGGGYDKNSDDDGNEYEPEYDPVTAGNGNHKLIAGKGDHNAATDGGNGHSVAGHAPATGGQSVVFASGYHIAYSIGHNIVFSSDQAAGHELQFAAVPADARHTAPQPVDHVAVEDNAVLAIIGVSASVIDHVMMMM